MRPAGISRLAASEKLGRAEADEPVALSMTFELRNRARLEALLAAQQLPGSPEYHRWLSPGEFADRFGAAADVYGAMADWLGRQGLTVRTWPSRTHLDFEGSAGAVEAGLAVRMNAYRHRGRRALASADSPLLPANLAGAVRSVRLHTFRLAEPVARIAAFGQTITAMGPADLYTAYGFTSLLDAGTDGSGQTIAIVARSDFDAADVAAFQRRFDVPQRAPAKDFPGANPGIGSPGFACAGISNRQQRLDCLAAEESEVLLDIEWAGAAAPGAAVLVDISDVDIDTAIADIVENHPEAKVISMSFGLCERLDPSLAGTMEPLYAQAAAQGQTILVAAGNEGADGCDDGGAAGVNALSSAAEVTAVGGTELDPGFDASGVATGIVGEAVWNDRSGAGGGGVSTQVPKPAYQSAPGVPAGGFRFQPDVALMASPLTAGYFTIVEGDVDVIGGTSAATPIWAGIVALANQSAGADGLGAINAKLYALGSRQYGGTGATVFRDVRSGDNDFNDVAGFTAGFGYDLASGLGTPVVDSLVRAFAPAACAGDCSGDGVVTVDELVTAVRIALGAMSSSLCSALDADQDGRISIDELVSATERALHGC